MTDLDALHTHLRVLRHHLEQVRGAIEQTKVVLTAQAKDASRRSNLVSPDEARRF